MASWSSELFSYGHLQVPPESWHCVLDPQMSVHEVPTAQAPPTQLPESSH